MANSLLGADRLDRIHRCKLVLEYSDLVSYNDGLGGVLSALIYCVHQLARTMQTHPDGGIYCAGFNEECKQFFYLRATNFGSEIFPETSS